MSNSLIIAAITDTLRSLLDDALNETGLGVQVRTLPPRQIDTNGGGSQLNLFLYHTLPNADWRNRDIPWRTRPGERGNPPLALELYYMLTAYGQNNDERVSHEIMGVVMRALHDAPQLTAEQINLALPDRGGAGGFETAESIRITPVSISLDEMSRLWTTFQTDYRLSVAYEVSVVLIESTRAQRAAPPVLQRGADDRGVQGQANLTPPVPPFPVLTGVDYPNGESAVELGGTFTLRGHNLGGDDLTLWFSHPRIDGPVVVTGVVSDGDNAVSYTLPAEWPWPPGLYQVSLGTPPAEPDGPPPPPDPLADAPVPYTAPPAEACPGFQPSRLVIGQQGEMTTDSRLRVRTLPQQGGGSEVIMRMNTGDVFSVLDGPVCDDDDGIAWWLVQTDGTIGWTAEGRGAEYWVSPVAAPVSCPYLSPRLSLGGRAVVLGTGNHDLRRLPSLDDGLPNNTVLTTLSMGDTVAVLAGPVCDDANESVWWLVYDGTQTGWLREGASAVYWLDPVPAPSEAAPPSETRTNLVPVAIAPALSDINVTRQNGAVRVALTVSPPVYAGQTVTLLFGARGVTLPPLAGDTATNLLFTVPDVAPGTVLLRLRVDGVDSLLVDRTQSPPAFRPEMQVDIP